MGLEHVFAGRRRAMARECPACWAARIFSLVREKIFPGQVTKFSRSAGGNFPFRAGGASCLKTGGPLGATAVAETGAEGGGVLLFVNIFRSRLSCTEIG